MLKSLRVPERLFQLAGWVVSVVFAGFLIGLGGKLVGELPGVEQYTTLERFMDPARTRRMRIARDSLIRLERDLSASRDRAQLSLTASSNAYRSRRESFDNWIATRVATTDPRQDPEVLRRTAELDQLKSGELPRRPRSSGSTPICCAPRRRSRRSARRNHASARRHAGSTSAPGSGRNCACSASASR
jgi:hypothetical protein